eukprot:15484845-Alexandrium_andersonii.AAC.1
MVCRGALWDSGTAFWGWDSSCSAVGSSEEFLNSSGFWHMSAARLVVEPGRAPKRLAEPLQ